MGKVPTLKNFLSSTRTEERNGVRVVCLENLLKKTPLNSQQQRVFKVNVVHKAKITNNHILYEEKNKTLISVSYLKSRWNHFYRQAKPSS